MQRRTLPRPLLYTGSPGTIPCCILIQRFTMPTNSFSFQPKKIFYPAKALGYICKGEALDRIASYPESLEAAFQGLEMAKTLIAHRSFAMGRAYSLIGHVYNMTGNEKESVEYFHTALGLLETSHEYSEDLCLARFSMGF
ncbi:MAG: hypothetical protein WDM78_01735 [Puia sp.]